MRLGRSGLGFGVGLLGALVSVLSTAAVAVDRTHDAPREIGQLVLDVRDADTGAPLPARVMITPAGLLASTRTLVTRGESVRAELAAGEHHLSISHGPEWSTVAQRVSVAPGGVARVHATIARLIDASAYTACDLHVHTSASPDSDLTLDERISTLLAEDVSFAVITDHNHVTAAAPALAAVGIGSLPGVEITTWAPEFGHFNAFPQVRPPRYAGTHARALLRTLRRTPGVFVQVNHPRLERHIGYFELASFERTRAHDEARFPLAFDAIEVWNGYDLAAPHRRDAIFHDWLALLARGRRVTASGGSDAHRAGAAPYVGHPRTYVHVPRALARDASGVLQALKQGRSFVSNGPVIALHARGLGAGDTLRLAHGERFVQVEIEVLAPAWMRVDELAVWAGDHRVAHVPLSPRSDAPGVRGHHHRVPLMVPVAHARSLVATVSGSASMKPLFGRAGVTPFAFTNPLWLERP